MARRIFAAVAWLFGALALVVVAACACMFLLQTQPGRTWLAAEVSRLGDGPGRDVEISGIGGIVPFSMRLGQISLADGDGIWLEGEDVAAEIAPLPLLEGRLVIRHAGARRLRLERAPRGIPPGDAGTPSRPPPPIAIDDLAVARLELGPALVGGMAGSVPEALRLAARGQVVDGNFDLDASAEAAPGAEPRLRIDALLRGRLAPFAANVHVGGSVGDLAILPDVVRALTGGETRFALSGHVDGESVRADALSVEGDGLSLGGSARVEDGFSRLVARLDLGLKDLSPFGQAIGQPAEGALVARLDLAGPLNAPTGTLDAKGERGRIGPVDLDGASARVEIGDGPWPSGRIAARLARPEAHLATAFRAEDGRIAFDDLEAAAPGADLRGRLEIATAPPALDGRIELALGDLGRLVALAPQTAGFGAGGKGALALVLAAPQGRQGARLSGTLRDLRAGAVKVARLSLDGEGEDLLAPGRKMHLSARVGRIAAPVPSDGGTIAAHLDGDTGRIRADLDAGGGRLVASAKGNARGFSGEAEARGLPLALLSAFGLSPGGEMRGRLDARASIMAGEAGARGSFDLAGRDLALGNVPPLGLDARGRWDGRRVEANVRATGAAGTRLEARAALPLRWRAADGSIDLKADAPLDGRFSVDADLGRLAALLPLGEDRLAGRLEGSGTIDGTLAGPRVRGSLGLSRGRYENAARGTIVDALAAEVLADGGSFRLARLSGTDGGDGRLSGTGKLSLDGGPSWQGAIDLKGFRVARRETLEASADARIETAGSAEGGRIFGKVTILRADATLPGSLPPSVPDIPVVEVNGPSGPAPAQGAPGLLSRLALDVAVNAPGRVFVRGRGLDSEWRGTLAVGGTAARPEVSGNLSVVRGSIALAGKRFPIERGTVTIPPGAMDDPLISVEATLPGADIMAKAEVEGPVSAPRLSLTSEPPLPQDEILSRVLFGRNVASLGAMEAVTLARSALELSGKGGDGSGPLDRVRRFLGLDRLDIGGDEAGTPSAEGATGLAEGGQGASPGLASPSSSGFGGALGGSAISAGRYVAPGVYVGIRQGVAGGAPSATVEAQITPSLGIESSVGSGGGGGVGLVYKRDY